VGARRPHTSESFTSPAIVNVRTQSVYRWPASRTRSRFSPDHRYAAIIIENERDEDLNDGLIPQAPAGTLQILDLPWLNLRTVPLTGLADYAPDDPEPEFVDVNRRNEAVVSLQENNHLAIVIAAATVIALGTYTGGWRIRTLGHRITDIETPPGFGAETSSAVVILAASQAGYPLSTTHVTSGGVIGAGVGKRAAEVRWGTARSMVVAWVLTIPAAALIAGGLYLLTEGLGTHIAGPPAVSCMGAVAAAALFAQTQRAERVTARDV
jgi:hypothetical protein